MLRPFRKPAALLASVLLLAGCSGEPSARDMEKAVAKSIQDTLDQAKQFVHALGGRNAPQVQDFGGFDSFEKVSCNELQDNRGWNCEFRFTATFNGQTETATERGRFFQTDKGWVVEMGT